MSSWVRGYIIADRFWVGDTGNWSDALNHWSASTGGAPNASKPTSSDNVFFDGNSFTVAGRTVTIDETASCLDMDWTGVTDSPTLAGGSNILVYGSAIFVGMSITHTGFLAFEATAPGETLTTNGISVTSEIIFQGVGGGWTLQDNLTSPNTFWASKGTLDLNGKVITVNTFNSSNANTRTLNFSASTVNCLAWTFTNITNLTFNADTSTIKITGTGALASGGLTFNNVELNGTAHTISGDNTFSKLTIGQASTITFTDTSTQTIGAMERKGVGTVTLTGTGAGGWALLKLGGGVIDLYDCTIDYGTVTPKNTWFTGKHSTDGGNNSGWDFRNRDVAVPVRRR